MVNCGGGGGGGIIFEGRVVKKNLVHKRFKVFNFSIEAYVLSKHIHFQVDLIIFVRSKIPFVGTLNLCQDTSEQLQKY